MAMRDSVVRGLDRVDPFKDFHHGLLGASRKARMSYGGIVKLRLTAAFGAQHGGFTTGWNPVSCGSLDELFANLTMP